MCQLLIEIFEWTCSILAAGGLLLFYQLLEDYFASWVTKSKARFKKRFGKRIIKKMQYCSGCHCQFEFKIQSMKERGNLYWD